MTAVDTSALRALADAATPGPWRWCNTQRRNGSIYLQGARTRIVMAFKRMGMTGAQPMFRGADGLLYETATANINDFPDAAYIAALDPDTVRALCDAADEVERLRDEVARWESGRRVKVLPVLPEHPDALNLAADLLRKQTGEYYDTDAAMRAAAIALRDVDQIARQSRTAHAALVGELRAAEAEWHDAWSSVALDDNEAPVLRQVALAWLSARAIVRALLDRHAPEEGS